MFPRGGFRPAEGPLDAAAAHAGPGGRPALGVRRAGRTCASPISRTGPSRSALTLSKGGSITYLANMRRNGNLVNSYDLGRQIEQSDYSGPRHPAPPTARRIGAGRTGLGILESGDSFGHAAPRAPEHQRREAALRQDPAAATGAVQGPRRGGLRDVDPVGRQCGLGSMPADQFADRQQNAIPRLAPGIARRLHRGQSLPPLTYLGD